MDWNLFWTAVGAIGSSVGALTTAIAVIVALWQTKFSQKKKLRLLLSANMSIHPPVNIDDEKYVTLMITNTGNRDIVIEKWGYLLNKSIYLILSPDITLQSIQPSLPQRLSIEESLTLITKQNSLKNNIQAKSKKLLMQSVPIKFFVVDSAGHTYYAKPSKITKKYLTSFDKKQ